MREMNSFDRWVMCTRKRQFIKEKTANKWARKISGRSYLCPLCNQWHITKKRRAFHNTAKET